ncbi:MAG: hypothetical protein WC817_01280 [Patescibacteria group bacterium]|jgi:hypothetical protein
MKSEQRMHYTNPEQFVAPEPQEDWERTRPLVFEHFRKWGRVSALIGVLFAGRQEAEAGPFRYDAAEYVATRHITHEETVKLEEREHEIAKTFGDAVLRLIKSYDMVAHMERKEQYGPAVFSGFEKSGLKDHEAITASWNEESGRFPKGWINGEIDQIEFTDQQGKDYRRGGAIGYETGGFQHRLVTQYRPDTPSRHDQLLLLYSANNDNRLSAKERENLPRFYDETFTHETGHANDWINDKELSLQERLDLLHGVHQRLIDTNRYRDPEVDGIQYYESANDGTSDGLHKSAKEYWAEIVATYFTNPEFLRSKFPNDFALVDQQARRNDPSFDIFKTPSWSTETTARPVDIKQGNEKPNDNNIDVHVKNPTISVHLK